MPMWKGDHRSASTKKRDYALKVLWMRQETIGRVHGRARCRRDSCAWFVGVATTRTAGLWGLREVKQRTWLESPGFGGSREVSHGQNGAGTAR